jgi:hypothetical protein
MNDEVIKFLHNVIPNPQPDTHLHLYVKGTGHLWPTWSELPGLQVPDDTDVYFSVCQYTEPQQDLPDEPVPAPNSLPTNTLALDIDTADLMYLPLIPTILVKTSAIRHQVYYIFDSEANLGMAQSLVLNIEGADHLSCRPGHMFRLPTTYNHKYQKPYLINIIQNTSTIHQVEDILPTTNGYRPYTDQDVLSLVRSTPEPEAMKPQAYLEDLHLTPGTTLSYDEDVHNKTEVMRDIIIEMARKKAPLNNIYFMARTSANNYFKGLQYNQDYELAKHVLKLKHLADTPDTKSAIKKIRTSSSTDAERMEHIYDCVLDTMLLLGTFYHTKMDGAWYVPKGTAHSIMISKHSEALQHYLNRMFTLNTIDIDTSYVISNLTAFVSGLPQHVIETKLAYYNKVSNRLSLYTGAGTTYLITPNNVQPIHNGEYGALFHPMQGIFIPFIPQASPLVITRYRPDPDNPLVKRAYTTTYDHWSEALFGPFLDNISNLTHEEARAILSAWLLFLFFKNSAPSRPLLAIFGQPGSGKSTLLKRVSHFLYGKLAGVIGVTTPSAYDHAAFVYPQITIDNVDTWEKWLPDRLAQAAGMIDDPRKKLYTDDQTIVLTRDAMVALTAHDPKFSRPDIADRLLILRKSRFEDFVDEAELMAMPRSAMWYQMMQDLSVILATPKPAIPEQLRIQDFASIGSWISAGLGLLHPFQSALLKMRDDQRMFAMENDQTLLDAAIEYATLSKTADEFKPPAKLYAEMEYIYGRKGDASQFTRKYRNPTTLSNRLHASQEALRRALHLEQNQDEFGRRTWKITLKPKDNLPS